MAKQRRHLGEIIYKVGLVEKKELIEAIVASRNSNQRLGEILIEKGLIDEESLTMCIAKQFSMEYIDVDMAHMSLDALRLVPEELAKKHNVIPMDVHKGRLRLLISDPTDIEMMNAIRSRLNTDPACYLGSPTKIRAFLNETYGPVENADQPPSGPFDTHDHHRFTLWGTKMFEYTALDSQGVEIKGEVEAQSQKEAIDKIRYMDYFPTRVSTPKRIRRAKTQTVKSRLKKCKTCWTKNRIPTGYPERYLSCEKCGCIIKVQPSIIELFFWNLILLTAIAAVINGIAMTPSLLKKDFSELDAAEDSKKQALEKGEEKKLSDLEAQLKTELAQIDPTQLHAEAASHYSSIFDARRSYDSRYVLTPREKAQLRMREMATDSTKSYLEAIKAVALEASPKGSDIEVSELFGGTALSIDFDMSSLTSGEHGTSTKHHTKTTLKKEVETLISRVTNDLFQSCKDLDLQTISVGCRHYVITERLDRSTYDKNIVLFKIRIQKKDVPELWNNPFLDVYSTTQYFEVEEDNFGTIEIVTTRI